MLQSLDITAIDRAIPEADELNFRLIYSTKCALGRKVMPIEGC
jgi:hypothetical protein